MQLRLKNVPDSEILRTAREIQAVADELGRFFIVNDRADIAIQAGADGVHLGQDDMPVAEARRICPEEMMIGASVSDAAEARRAVDDGADYVAVGAVFATPTKPDAPAVGLDAVYFVRQEVGDEVPVVAIGGINRGNIEHVIWAGADCVAVVSAVMAQKDIRAAAKELKTMVLNVQREKEEEHRGRRTGTPSHRGGTARERAACTCGGTRGIPADIVRSVQRMFRPPRGPGDGIRCRIPDPCRRRHCRVRRPASAGYAAGHLRIPSRGAADPPSPGAGPSRGDAGVRTHSPMPSISRGARCRRR